MKSEASVANMLMASWGVPYSSNILSIFVYVWKFPK